MNYSEWREPRTKAFSCEYRPGNKSCDNGVLFSAEAFAHDLISERDFLAIVEQYENPSGCLLRYPNIPDWCSWDDYVGAASVSQAFALRAYRYLSTHDWTTPSGSKLWRFPIFIPAIKAGAGMKISPLDQFFVFIAFLANCFEPKNETSGKILLWLCEPYFRQYGLLKPILSCWAWTIAFKYERFSEMIHIYFPDKAGHRHPFVEKCEEMERSK